MNQNFYDKLNNVIAKDSILIDEPMSRHTTFRVGGPADFFVTPKAKEEVRDVVRICKEAGMPYYIIGNGSNLLVSDAGYRGVIVQIYKEMNEVKVEGDLVKAQAGALLSGIAAKALGAELSGFEFASGIPGTIGGACVMNAGAYGGEMKDVLESVTVLTGEGKIIELGRNELELGYRTSVIAKKGYIVLGVVLKLERGDGEKIKTYMDELKEKRVTKQPLEYPSAGSTFKRPEGYFAGKLIEDAGLRGFQVGGAQVSEKHCGFVINRDHATAADIMELMRQVIVTGMSGAGKSTALKMLEDMGYFCVDNLPVPLIPKFAELLAVPGTEMNKAALGVDIRSGQSFQELANVLKVLDEGGCQYEILYLESSDDVLVKRYKETRRFHPLAGSDGRVEDGLKRERELLGFLKKKADYLVDTSHMLTRELKAELNKIFVQNKEYKNLYITVLSFGFKYGIPNDADLVFDVRFLPNPYYIEELRPMSGNDQPVRDYVMNNDTAKQFLTKLTDMVEFLIPNYISEGKTQLVIGIGCTGGKHRSVTLANELYEALKKTDSYGVRIEHRDIGKDAITKAK